MRVAGLIMAVVALFLTSPVLAQDWGEYVNREEFFTVNFPGAPSVKEQPYKTVKGTELKAKIFTADAAPGSLLEGRYSMTVVNYASASGEVGDAIQQAADAIRKMGVVKYDEPGNIDRIHSQRLTVETPDGKRILAEILVEANRLYIVEANVPQNVPPPAQFQASVQILDKDGVRIRYQPDGVTRQR